MTDHIMDSVSAELTKLRAQAAEDARTLDALRARLDDADAWRVGFVVMVLLVLVVGWRAKVAVQERELAEQRLAFVMAVRETSAIAKGGAR